MTIPAKGFTHQETSHSLGAPASTNPQEFWEGKPPSSRRLWIAAPMVIKENCVQERSNHPRRSQGSNHILDDMGRLGEAPKRQNR